MSLVSLPDPDLVPRFMLGQPLQSQGVTLIRNQQVVGSSPIFGSEKLKL